MSRSSQGQCERAPYAEKSDKNNNNEVEARGKDAVSETCGGYSGGIYE